MKRRIYLSMKSLAEARELWLSRFDLDAMAKAEEVPVTAAAGRVTAGPVMALEVLARRPTRRPWTVLRWPRRERSGPPRTDPGSWPSAGRLFPSTPGMLCRRGPMR